jgi:pimeloyl-ACP methyl ester carboxylesterase
MNTEEPKYCITLVHGTFAPKAPWTQDGSILHQTFQNNLDGPILFSSLAWSGANSPWVRHEAAQQLAAHLNDQIEAHPAASHFVVGHSHGGNIALMSCCDADVSSRLSGVICLATPFLSYKRRRVRPYLSVLVFSLFAFIVFGALSLTIPEGEMARVHAALDTSAESGMTFWQQARANAEKGRKAVADGKLNLGLMVGGSFQQVSRQFGASGAMLLLVALCVALAWSSSCVVSRIARRIQSLQTQTAELYRMPGELPFRMLGFWVPFDEARWDLRMVWRLTEIPYQITPFLIGFYGLFFIGGMVWTLQDGLTQMNLNHSPQAWIWCSFLIILSATFMVTLMFVPLTEAAMYLCIFIRGNPLGFGWEGWTGSWLGRIIASQQPPLPAACYEMRRIPAKTIAAEIGERNVILKLRHSLLYGSPTVVRGVADWMKQQTVPASSKG